MKNRLKRARERAPEFVEAGDYALDLAFLHNVLDEAKANKGRKVGERGVRRLTEERLERIRGNILSIQCRAESPLSDFRGQRAIIEGCDRGLTDAHPIVKRIMAEIARRRGRYREIEGLDGQYREIGEVDFEKACGGKAMLHIARDTGELVFIYADEEGRQVYACKPRYLSKQLAVAVLIIMA
jgi:hypothetical protein